MGNVDNIGRLVGIGVGAAVTLKTLDVIEDMMEKQHKTVRYKKTGKNNNGIFDLEI